MTVIRNRAAAEPERGDTLIELLIALVIIGGVVVAMFNGLMSVTRGSTVHRSTTNVDTLAKSYLEAAIQQIEQPTGGIFAECATSGTYTTGVTWTNPSSYTGYASPTVTSVQYWSPSASSFTPACTTGTSKDGLQAITVQAVAPDGSIAIVSSTVRNPSYSSTDCGVLGSC